MRTGALAQPQFRLLLSRQAISSLGDYVVPVALAFAVLDLTNRVSDLGIVIASQTLPLVAFVLLGGVWADRLLRQRVLLASDLVRAIAQGASGILLVTGHAHVWELAVLQAVYGVGRAFAGPALTPLVAETVEPPDRQQANALIELSANVASVLGPALAGVLVATIGPGWGLVFDAATFVAGAAFVAAMRPRPASASPAPRMSMRDDLKGGWRAFSSRPWVWITVLFFTLYIGFVYAPWQVLGPEVARTSLGGAGAWAAISAALGVGALGGGILGMRWRPRHPLRVAFTAFLVFTPAMYVLLAAHAPLWAIIAAALFDGSSGTLFNVLWFTALQTDVPPDELSRVSSWDYLGTLAALPIGQALAGPVAIAIGVSTTLYGAAGLCAVLVGCMLAIPAVGNFTIEATAA